MDSVEVFLGRAVWGLIPKRNDNGDDRYFNCRDYALRASAIEASGLGV